MVCSIFNEKGQYIGCVWGFECVPDPRQSEFRCRALGTKTTLGPFQQAAKAEEAVRVQYLEIRSRLDSETPRFQPRQLSLGL